MTTAIITQKTTLIHEFERTENTSVHEFFRTKSGISLSIFVFVSTTPVSSSIILSGSSNCESTLVKS